MKEIVTKVFSLEDYPVCADCRYAHISYWNNHKPKPEEIEAVSCTRVVSGPRDLVTGTDPKGLEMDAVSCRNAAELCGVSGRWFEPKA